MPIHACQFCRCSCRHTRNKHFKQLALLVTIYFATSSCHSKSLSNLAYLGQPLKFLFIAFNLLMLLWLSTYWKDVGGMVDNGSDAERAGAAIGATLGTGMLMALWGFGDIILGLLVLFTRPKGT